MPPQQPSPGYGPTMPAPPPSSGQFDFIMGAGAVRHPTPALSNASGPKRLLIVIGGCLLLLFIGMLFFSLLSKSSGTNAAALLSLAQKQTELARVSQQSVGQAAAPATRNFGETAYLALTSDQAAFVKYMKTHGIKAPSTKTLSATQSSATDATLSQAQTTGTYDSTYISIAQSQLTAYEQSLSQAFAAAAKRPAEQQLLQNAYKHAQILQTMSKQT